MNPLLKFVILLHTKSDEKLPHDNISHFLFLEVARGYNLSCASAMHFGPSTLLFGKIWYKMFQGFLRCMQVWKWEDRKIPGTQHPGVHRPWSSGINFAGSNNIHNVTRIQKWYWYDYWNYTWHNRNCNTGHDDVTNGNIFCVTGHLCREFTGDRWIPCTKASDAKLRCFLWFAPE